MLKTKRNKVIVIVIAVIIALFYTINYVLTYNTYVFSKKLLNAIYSENVSNVEEVLDKFPDGDVNCPEYSLEIIPSLLETYNRYPIHAACEEGNYDMVKLIVERGADLNVIIKDDCLENPILFYVVGMYWPDEERNKICKYLIKHGADPKQPNAIGEQLIDLVKSDKASIESGEIEYHSEKKRLKDIYIINELLDILQNDNS